MRIQLQSGLVLHRRPYRESSVLVELLTADHGRVGAVARGARRHASLLQPFQPLLASWSSRSGELVSLGGLERDPTATYSLTGTALTCGLYVNELLSRLLARNDPHPKLFADYQQCLSELARGVDFDWLLRRFEIKLLTELGYGLVLDVETERGRPVEPGQLYCYEAEQGPIAVRGGQSSWHVRGDTLLALLADSPPMDEVTRREAKQLMQAVIDYQLGGYTLKTRELLRPIWK